MEKLHLLRNSIKCAVHGFGKPFPQYPCTCIHFWTVKSKVTPAAWAEMHNVNRCAANGGACQKSKSKPK